MQSKNAPTRWFASDNNAATHPLIMAALAEANVGHAIGYGDDPCTARAEASVATLFGADAEVRFVLTGTGANVYAIGCFAGQGDAVICSDCAHILVDETGAPSAVTGIQLVPLPSTTGKICPDQVVEAVHHYADMHKPRPVVLSISQPTELGTVYSVAEITALVDTAHQHGLVVHIDGARLANAAAALGSTLHAATGHGDVICFGGTKNGLMFGEAVVFTAAIKARLPDTARLRKTRLQLASKMRYIAAQFEAYVKDDLWLENARAANRAALRLYHGVRALGIAVDCQPDTNGVFARLPAPVSATLKANRFFYDWEGGLVRWMASWDTTDTDIDDFLRDLAAAMAEWQSRQPGDARLIDPQIAKRLRTTLTANRNLLKSNWKELEQYTSDQQAGLPMPTFVNTGHGGGPQQSPDISDKPEQPERPAGQPALISLPDPKVAGLGSKSFASCTADRRSRRKFTADALSLAELSFLLWASQGVRGQRPERFILRTVPSGGSRHPLDCHVYVRRVTGLASGLYRFMPVEHALAWTGPLTAQTDQAFDTALLGQLWNCAALIVWTAVPYRSEWRYTVAAGKLILLDAGHACQALYGACEALDLGTCAIGAYDQAALDACLVVDGVDEFAVYAAPVGRVPGGLDQ